MQRWSDELRDYGRHVGAARDLDVLQAAILRPALGKTDAAQPTGLSGAARRAAVEARRNALRWLSSAERPLLPLEFARDLHGINLRSPCTDIGAFAADALARLRKKARKRLKTARVERSNVSFHRLRIALKRLRYALEFFAPLMPAKRLAPYVKAVAHAQDDLGYLNDVAVAKRTFKQWAAANAALREEAGTAIAWHRSRVLAIRDRILPQVDSVLRVPPW